MRLIERKGPFQVIDLLLEEPKKEEIEQLMQQYARVSILTYCPLSLPARFRLIYKKTPNIYVNISLDDVFRGFRDTVRNEIKRTERLPEFEIRLPDTNYSEIERVFSLFEFAQGRAPYSREYLKKFVAASAYYQGRLISCILFFQSGKFLRVRFIFSTRLSILHEEDKELYKIIGYATKALVYRLCAYAKEHGAVLVDLASINLTDPEKEPIARFKRGFGAKIEDEYQYVYSAPMFRLFEKAASWKARFRVVISRFISSLGFGQ